jgi:hypothetical protein
VFSANQAAELLGIRMFPNPRHDYSATNTLTHLFAAGKGQLAAGDSQKGMWMEAGTKAIEM